ncbi:MAG: threonine--tRNA ligase, partial [Candidatus Eremiobacteraeota bacterium]|nr:threonine--tRNA ligase [Candidatus Eremiobacteraeota bacterium]
PVWLAPVQAVVTPISEQQLPYARELAARLCGAGFRVETDESNEKLGYKIRHWKTQKVPYILVVGKQEVADGTVNVNARGVEEKRTVSVGSFVEELRARVEGKE